MSGLSELEKEVIRMEARIKALEEKSEDLYNELEKEYVRKSEFGIVRIIVFGMVGTIIMAFLKILIDKTFHQ